LIRVR